jgi:hypothetical protein
MSEEYGGKYAGLTSAMTKELSMNSSNTAASVELRKTRLSKTCSWAYAGRIRQRSSRWNRDTCRGATPSGDQPVRQNLNSFIMSRFININKVVSLKFGELMKTNFLQFGTSLLNSPLGDLFGPACRDEGHPNELPR